MEHKLMQDSLNKAENIRKITQLEIQYAFDKKQRRIENQINQERQANEAKMQQQRFYIFGLSIVLIFIVLFGILIFRQKNLQVKFKTIDLEQKLLRTQMNPHFIFNSLTAIQDFMYKNNAKEAGNFLSRFASLMRQILENSRTEYVTIENEINMLNNYLEIQKLRFEKKFTYEINVDRSIDQETYSIPPMLAQPFIENAIEHGLIPKKEAGIIYIRLNMQNGLLKYEIEDNGVGRKEAEHSKEDHKTANKSLATKLTQERIAYLKKQTGKDHSFQIDDLIEKGKPAGTRVTFSVSYQKIYS
jgi:LytS/YehU family sensor histidine kinase